MMAGAYLNLDTRLSPGPSPAAPGWTPRVDPGPTLSICQVCNSCAHVLLTWGSPWVPARSPSGGSPAPAALWQQGSSILLRKDVSDSGSKNNPFAFSSGNDVALHRSTYMSYKDDSSVIFL